MYLGSQYQELTLDLSSVDINLESWSSVELLRSRSCLSFGSLDCLGAKAKAALSINTTLDVSPMPDSLRRVK